jgi:hypothetical protein
MKYALLIVLALASTATAQCVNCQVPTLAPQQAVVTQSIVSLPLQEITVAERRPSILEGMAIRQQSRQAARRASFTRYPSVSATYSAGSTGTLQAVSLGSVGTYSAPPQAVYSLGSVGTYQTPAPTYSLGSTGTPTVSAPTPACVCAPACACVNCNCAPAVFSAPATVPCINCVPAAPITYSVPTPSIIYTVPTTQSVSYSVPVQPVSYSPTRSFATPVRSVSSNYAIALRSATERAMRGIKGHLSSIERQAGKRVGVGWSSHNPNPSTCFNNLPGDYAVARGRDGYYATKIVY